MRPIRFRSLGANLRSLAKLRVRFPHAPSTKLKEEKDFGRNPGALRMFSYAPPSLQMKAPLVVILHGCGQTAADYEYGTGWAELADQLGFAVLAPEQTRENNVNGCFNWFQVEDTAREQGEAASIRQMIERIAGDLQLDRGRIFITGLSAGGAMTAAMLTAYPEIFAGGAIIAGLPVGPATNMGEAHNIMREPPELPAKAWGDFVRKSSAHKGSWPVVSVWHGDSDVVVHPRNAEALIAQWTNVHGLPSPHSHVETHGEHHRRTWVREDGTIAVEAFSISGMGHGLPVGGPSHERYGEPGPYFLDVGLSSTARIANFWGFPVESTVKTSNGCRSDDQAGAKKHMPAWDAVPGSKGGVMGTILSALKSANLLEG